MVICAYCGEPCKRETGGTDREGNELWFHHGRKRWWDDDEPSCYEKAQWESHGEESLLDWIMGLKPTEDDREEE